MTKNKFLRLSTTLLGSFALLSMTIIKSKQNDPWDAPVEYQNMKNPYAGLEDDEKIGRIVYSKYCKFCHGNKGKGDGPQAKLVDTPVADFTMDSFKNQTDGSLYYKIYTGRNDMPSFEKIITDDEDLWMVINYIRDL